MASIATMTRYNLNDFESMINNGFKCELSDEVLGIIQQLADQVGAPEYIKTPQFVRRERGSADGYKQPRRRRGKQKAQELSDEAWQQIRNFEATKREDREGIDKSIDSVRKAMNKISNKTYDTLKTTIFTELNTILDSGIDVEGEDMTKLVNSLFKIASQNGFYSELYAKLYSELVSSFDFIKLPLDAAVENYISELNTITYVSSDDDYDMFCKNNKDNTERRARGTFFINAYLHDLVKADSIIDILNEVQDKITAYISEEDQTEIVNELSELLGEMLPAIISAVNKRGDDSFNEDLAEIVSNVETVSKYTSKQYPSLSNKSVFKHMDILECDEVEELNA